MARVVLIAVCGVLVFVLVSKFAPHFLETYLPAATSSGGAAASPNATDKTDKTDSSKAAPAKRKTAAPKPKPGPAAGSSATASAAPSKSEAANPEVPIAVKATSVQAPQIPSAAKRPVARVTAENANLYSTNTGGGQVVGSLAKGAVVEPVFVVSTAGQTWTFVSTSDQEIAGFLRSDTLAKPRQTDQSR